MTDQQKATEPDKERDAIRASFTRQAENFDSFVNSAAKQEFRDHCLQSIQTEDTGSVLDVAAGTCVMGRALAVRSASVTCLDLTEAMLAEGQRLAEAEHIRNMIFVLGDAEGMPFLKDSFDSVITRLSFHHFSSPRVVFQEMHRVLKPGGRLIVIDMLAPREDMREVRDQLETLRDGSHVRLFSLPELKEFFKDHAMELTLEAAADIPVRLDEWLSLSRTPQGSAAMIRDALAGELNGVGGTGFCPFFQDGEICLQQRWAMLIGRKK